MSSTWLGKIKNLLHQPPFLILKDVLDKIPGCPVRVSWFMVLELPGSDVKTLRECGTVRAGTVADVPGMCLLENKHELFLNRFAEGESCVVAVRDDAVVGYLWFSGKAFHREQRYNYRLEIPQDSIYSYDCFIHRDFRLRGIWVLFQKYMLEQATRLGRKNIIAMIDYGNDASVKTHLRFGYLIKRNIFWVRCFCTDYFLSRDK